MNKEFKIPAGICSEAKQYVKSLLQELKNNEVEITTVDYLGLEIIAHTYDLFIEATAIIEKEGMTIKENDGSTKIHPAIQIQYNFKTELNKWIEQYELTTGELQKFKR